MAKHWVWLEKPSNKMITHTAHFNCFAARDTYYHQKLKKMTSICIMVLVDTIQSMLQCDSMQNIIDLCYCIISNTSPHIILVIHTAHCNRTPDHSSQNLYITLHIKKMKPKFIKQQHKSSISIKTATHILITTTIEYTNAGGNSQWRL